MENRGSYSHKDIEGAKRSIHHSLGYRDKGLEVYCVGLGI